MRTLRDKLWLAVGAVVGCLCASPASAAPYAKGIIDASGVKGGLAVHVGCGNGRLTAALRVNDSFLVHGLDTDARNVGLARQHIGSRGLYGKVAVDTFDGNRLPYVDNLVNLLVADDLLKLAADLCCLLGRKDITLIANVIGKAELTGRLGGEFDAHLLAVFRLEEAGRLISFEGGRGVGEVAHNE